jgi:GNAT superfamily N-acetyltransferase
LLDDDPDREAVWIARCGDEPLGSVFCVRKDQRTAQLRLLLVEPRARRLGVGSDLVTACVGFARDRGYRRLVLWTNDVLVDARRVYERAGFRLEDEEPHHSFGADLSVSTGRSNCELRLPPSMAPRTSYQSGNGTSA